MSFLYSSYHHSPEFLLIHLCFLFSVVGYGFSVKGKACKISSRQSSEVDVEGTVLLIGY